MSCAGESNLRYLLYLILVVAGLTVSLMVGVNAGLFHSQIEGKLSETLQAQVKLGQITIGYGWPLEVRFGPSQIVSPIQNLSWNLLLVQVNRLIPPFGVHIQADLLVAKILNSQTAAGVGGAGGGAGASPGDLNSIQWPNISLSLQLNQCSLQAAQGKIRNLDLKFEQKLLMRSEASIELRALLESPDLPIPMPLEMRSSAVVITSSTVKTTAMQIALGGFRSEVRGASLFDEGRHRWAASISAPDLSKLPQAPIEIPAKNWRGSMQGKVEFLLDGPNKPLSIDGDMQIRNMSAVLDWQREETAVSGPFQMELSTKFRYASARAEITTLTGKLDLTAAKVTQQGILNKDAGVPFSLNWAINGDPGHITVSQFEVDLWKLAFRAKGAMQTKAPYPGQFDFVIPRMQLAGLEAVLLPLGKTPVQGSIELRGHVQGPLGDMKQADLKIEAAQLSQVAASLDWKSVNSMVQGPIRLNLLGQANLIRGEVKAVSGVGQADLSALSLVAGPVKKTAGQKLILNFNFKENADLVDVKKFEASGFFGSVQASGQIKSPFKPYLKQLRLVFAPLDLVAVRGAMRENAEMIPAGVMTGQVGLQGSFPPEKPWHDWPLLMRGEVQIKIPEYKMTGTASDSSLPPAKVPNAATPPSEAETLLPKGYLTSAFDLKFFAEIAKFQKDDLVLKGMKVSGTVRDGWLRGDVDISEIFMGNMNVHAVQIPLLTLRPVIQGQASWQNMDIQTAIQFAKPEFKDFATGKMQGQANFVSYMPSDPAFIPSLKSKGNITAQPANLSTVKIGDAINGLLKKVPMAKIPPVRLESLKGKMRLIYEMKNQTFMVQKFTADDAGGSTLELAGTVRMSTLEGDLAGHFMWAKPPVKGCFFDSNADTDGRLTVPLSLKGYLMQPSFNLVSEALVKMGTKALACEQKKALDEKFSKKLKELFKK